MRRISKWYFPFQSEVDSFLKSIANIPYHFVNTSKGWDIYIAGLDHHIGRYFFDFKRNMWAVYLW